MRAYVYPVRKIIMMIYLRSLSLLTTLVLLHLSTIDGASPLLVYKEASLFHPSWDTHRYRHGGDCSTWRPFDQRFYPLGDTLLDKVISSGFPKRPTVMVMDKGDGLVAKPQSFSLVWHEANTWGSDGHWGVKIYKMIPSPGYTCLGHIAVNRWDYAPQDVSDRYRCVRSDFVNPGQVYRQWNTRFQDNTPNTEFKTPTSFWNVEPDPLDSTGMQTGLFLVGSGFDSLPLETPYVLNSSMVTFSESPADFKDIALILYETSQVDLIATSDSFEGPAHLRLSFTRAKESCCHLSAAVSNYYSNINSVPKKNKQPAFYLKEVQSKMLVKPADFQLIWNNDKGKGKDWISIYRPICPVSYVALGHVVTLGETNYKEASADDIRCVHKSLVTKGKWTKVWDTNGVPGVAALTVWRADAKSDVGVDVSIFSAVNRIGEMDTNAYVLRRDKVKINWGKRIVKVELSNEVYDFDNKKIISKNPIALNSRTTVNNCGNSTELKATRTLTFTQETESSWKFELSIEIGIEFEWTAKVPLIAQSTVRTSLKVGTMYGQERRLKESVQDQVAVEVSVPAGRKAAFYIGGDKYVATVPWEADMLTTFSDGSEVRGTTRGMYTGIQVSEIKVIKERPVLCSPEDRQVSS